MSTADAIDLLTEKEKEALELVLQHMSSKEIALHLGGLSPKSIDQRLDNARAKLGAATRIEAARIYAVGSEAPEQFRYQPFPVSGDIPDVSSGASVPDEAVYTLGDAATFGFGESWRNLPRRDVPRFDVRTLNIPMRLLLIIAGAVAMLAFVLLSIGVMQGLNVLIS